MSNPSTIQTPLAMAAKPAGAAAGPASAAPPQTNPRQARIKEYRQASLSQMNPLVALIGAANADLLECDQALNDVILDTFKAGVNSLGDFLAIDPLVKRRIEALKQVEKFALLERKLAAPTAATSAPNAAGPLRQARTQ